MFKNPNLTTMDFSRVEKQLEHQIRTILLQGLNTKLPKEQKAMTVETPIQKMLLSPNRADMRRRTMMNLMKSSDDSDVSTGRSR